MNVDQLPVYRHKQIILDTLAANQVIVVESPTGSGKTTQIPQILYHAGYADSGVIGVTQPRRIAAVSVTEFIARQLNLPDQFARQIELSALLHDIGMLALPDSIALCAGRLNEQQLEAMRRHPLIGARILEGMEFLEMVTPQVRSHHERFDGKGYPDGLAGQSIPLAARIVAVADVFDAMTSRRAFRGAKSVTESLIELESEAGKQLDPNVVTAFLAEACRLGDKLTDVPLPKAEDEDEAEAPAEDAAEAHARSGAAAAG